MTESFNILLIEDDDVDSEAIIRTLRQQEIPFSVVVARDGAEAFQILWGEEERERLSYPYLILLDLKLPRMNGLEFLQQLRADPELGQSIVFILSSSNRDEDKQAAYGLGVAGYLLKPQLDGNLTELVTLLHLYSRLNQFPPSPGHLA